MARKRYCYMIIVFIIYLIFLIWLFEFIDIYGNHSLDRNLNQNITVIIDQINNLNDLFLTMDSIKLQNYNCHPKIKLEMAT